MCCRGGGGLPLLLPETEPGSCAEPNTPTLGEGLSTLPEAAAAAAAAAVLPSWLRLGAGLTPDDRMASNSSSLATSNCLAKSPFFFISVSNCFSRSLSRSHSASSACLSSSTLSFIYTDWKSKTWLMLRGYHAGTIYRLPDWRPPPMQQCVRFHCSLQ